MIRFLSRIALLLVLFPSAALAQGLDPADAAALDARTNAYAQAILRKDAAALFDFMPPQVKQTTATGLKLDVPAARDALVHLMDTALDGVRIERAEVVADQTTIGTTPTGRTYIRVFSVTEAVFPDGATLEETGHAIAFADQGIWYLVNVDTPRQIQFLTSAYPEFEDVPIR